LPATAFAVSTIPIRDLDTELAVLREVEQAMASP
jgi:hypothetical protein